MDEKIQMNSTGNLLVQYQIESISNALYLKGAGSSGGYAMRFLNGSTEFMRAVDATNTVELPLPNQIFQMTGANSKISGSATSTGSFGRVEATTFAGDGAALSNVPDYVFETEYVLRPLSEVESYVSQSKHLPGIPSMDEMDKWATYSVGDRDMLLLEKIEELTLYTIQLNKRIENLEDKKKLE
jgi:hypothetical protein